MTPKELYEWAKENYAENCNLFFLFRNFNNEETVTYLHEPKLDKHRQERIITLQ